MYLEDSDHSDPPKRGLERHAQLGSSGRKGTDVAITDDYHHSCQEFALHNL